MSSSASETKVFLVGAGPGDPELITVKGQRLLKNADVVVYDRLVHADLVDVSRLDADRIYVGKAPGRENVSQAEINALLITRAETGDTVVRLKGGDPFVYARGGEEALALQKAGIPFEVVPGITSAIGAPAYAGIPLTHRKVARSFTVITGHQCRPGNDNLDWSVLGGSDTLVILMGFGRLPTIADQLIKVGWTPETPAAVIQSGTTSDQVVVRAPLRDIGEQTRHLEPPATVVVGRVVDVGADLSWYTPADTDTRFPIDEPLEEQEGGDTIPEPLFAYALTG